MGAFQHKPQQNVMQHPQMPTQNGYQVAGDALREMGKAATDYSQIFGDMVKERKQAIWEDRKRNWEMEDREREAQDRQKKESEENDMKEKKRGFAEHLVTPPPEGVSTEDWILQGKIKHGLMDPDELIKHKLAPVNRQNKMDDWKEQEDYKHKNLMERGKKTAKNKGPDLTGLTPQNRQIVAQIHQNPSMKKDHLSKAKQAEQMAGHGLKATGKIIRDVKEGLRQEDEIYNQALVDYDRHKEALDSSRQLIKYLEATDSTNVSTNNGTAVPMEIQEAMKWLEENPNDPRAEGVKNRLQSEGYL